MLKRLFLYFSVVFVIVVLATSFNRFVIDKKKTVNEVMVETSQLFKTDETAKQEQKPARAVATVEDDEVGEKFKSWFQVEAGQISSTNLNLDQKEKELRLLAKSLTPQQLDYFKRKISSNSSSHDEKILSTYMLSLAGDVVGLSEVASRPLNVEPAEPHSVQEVQNNQQRAKAIMAIDAIAESKSPLSFRIDELRKIINKQDDVTVKNYAQRKQSELQSEL